MQSEAIGQCPRRPQGARGLAGPPRGAGSGRRQDEGGHYELANEAERDFGDPSPRKAQPLAAKEADREGNSNSQASRSQTRRFNPLGHALPTQAGPQGAS